jgi:hypothetical protein
VIKKKAVPVELQRRVSWISEYSEDAIEGIHHRGIPKSSCNLLHLWRWTERSVQVHVQEGNT